MAGAPTFVIFNGQLIRAVASAPTATQCILSGSGLTTGFTPFVGDDFFVFVQPTLTHGLSQTPLTGVRNGANLTFLLGTAPPAGSNVLLYFDGLLLNEVASAPTPQQFTITGQTIGLGLAPTNSSFLAAYIEDPASLAFFHEIAVQGSGITWVSTATAPARFTPVYAVFINGQLQEEVTSSPATTQYRLSFASGTLTFTLGFPMTSADDLQVFQLGLTAAAAPPPSLPLYRDMQNELLVLMNERIDLQEAKMCLNRRWQKILNAWSWSFVKTDGVITTKAPKTAGTVTVTQDSPLVVGAGTAFAPTDVGAYLLVGAQLYQVLDVQVLSATQQFLFLNSSYPGPTASTLPYQLVYKDYALDPDVVDIISMTGLTWTLEEITQESLDVLDANRSFTGQVSGFIRRGMLPDSIYHVELWPVPDARYTIHYVALIRTVLASNGQFIPDVAEVLLMAAEEMACGIVSSKSAAEKDYDGAQFWQNKGISRHANYLESLQELKAKDRRRFSGPSRDRASSLWAYQGVPGYDTGMP